MHTLLYIIIIITELYVQKLFDCDTCEMKTYRYTIIILYYIMCSRLNMRMAGLYIIILYLNARLTNLEILIGVDATRNFRILYYVLFMCVCVCVVNVV